MNVTFLVKRPVMDLATASTIGRIDDVLVDAATHRVVGFRLAKTHGRDNWLAWEHLAALGEDAVTVADAGVLRPTDDGVGRRLRGDKVLGGPRLTDDGVDLGTLDDVEIDPETGDLTSLSLSGGRRLPAASLIGIGSYATVVKDPETPQ